MNENNFINKDFTYAIVGASANVDKYGFKVMKDLILAGFKVIPINLKEKEIMGVKSFPSLKAAGQHIDVVVFVVPSFVGEFVVREVLALGITKLWLQPGAVSDKIIAFCEHNSIDCLHDTCIMLSH